MMFQVATLDSWGSIMHMFEQTNNVHVVRSFFLLVILVGAIFLLNVITAIMVSTFQMVAENDRRTMKHDSIDAMAERLSLLARMFGKKTVTRAQVIEMVKAGHSY